MNNIKHISVVVPVFNEQDSLNELNQQIISSIPKDNSYEIIYVNDGSTDDSKNIILSFINSNSNIKLINFYKNQGKATALNSAFKRAQGNILITLDADLQDDPKEIDKLISKIHEGNDMVSGWKQKRLDPLSKRLPSKIFNFILRFLTGIKIHDFNCGIKAYKIKAIKTIHLYGGLHRFIPALIFNNGFSVSEVIVNHRIRKYGKTKYGSSRLFHGFYDLLTILFLKKYLHRPLHLFGKFGLLFSSIGLIINLFLSYQWFIYNYFNEGLKFSINRPLLFLGILLLVIGIQFISIGLIGELIVYFNRKNNLDQDNHEFINFN